MKILTQRWHSLSGLGLCAIIAMGCASGPPQELTAQIGSTDTSIAQAEQAGAARGGLVELQKAKDKRANAQKALDDKKYELAMQLAQQAQVDAQFAANKARSEQARLSAEEVTRGTESLREEAARPKP